MPKDTFDKSTSSKDDKIPPEMEMFNTHKPDPRQRVSATRRGRREESPLDQMSVQERAARLNEWKAERGKRRQEARLLAEDSERLRGERESAGDGFMTGIGLPTKEEIEQAQEADVAKPMLTPRELRKRDVSLLRSMLIDDKWVPLIGQVREDRKELETITIELKEQGKSCTGCALKPYHAKFIKKLGEDFKDPALITPEEMIEIKKALQVKTLQVGIRGNGQAHVR